MDTETRVIDALTLRPLMRVLAPMRKGEPRWLSVTGVTWGPGGVWGVTGTDDEGRQRTSAWSDAQTVEAWQ